MKVLCLGGIILFLSSCCTQKVKKDESHRDTKKSQKVQIEDINFEPQIPPVQDEIEVIEAKENK